MSKENKDLLEINKEFIEEKENIPFKSDRINGDGNININIENKEIVDDLIIENKNKQTNILNYIENSENNENEDKEKKDKRKMFAWVGIGFVCVLFFFIGSLLMFKGYGKNVIEPKTNIIKELIEVQNEKKINNEEKHHKNNAVLGNIDEEKNNNVIVENTNIAKDYVEDVTTLPDMIENVMPSMVSITTTDIVSYYNPFVYGELEEYETESSGSGIIISQTNEELLILTNEHVINSAKNVVIGFIDETSVNGYVKSYDIESDLAIVGIKIENIPVDTLNNIKIATIGDSNKLRLGETVVAIGNSLGCGQSVTKGIISALDREIEMEDGTIRTFIQTDAPINPGNSGGALLNMKGEVIGINEVKIASSEVEGVGFAISISSAIDIIEELKNKEYREILANDEHGWLGISCRDVTPDVTELYNIPTGVFVYDIAKGSSADIAGIVRGDIIVEFDENKIISSDVLVDLITRYKVGETIEIKLLHYENGEYIEKIIELTLLAKQYE